MIGFEIKNSGPPTKQQRLDLITSSKIKPTGHFRVPITLTIKTGLSAKPFL